VKWKAPPAQAAGEGDFIAGRQDFGGSGAEALGSVAVGAEGSVPGHFTVGLAWPSKSSRLSSHEKYLCSSRRLAVCCACTHLLLVRLVRAGLMLGVQIRRPRACAHGIPTRAFRLLLLAARPAAGLHAVGLSSLICRHSAEARSREQWLLEFCTETSSF
jgi:hypothetical protein